MNSCNCPVRLLSPCTEKANESLSSLDPLFDAEGGALGPVFSIAPCAVCESLITLKLGELSGQSYRRIV